MMNNVIKSNAEAMMKTLEGMVNELKDQIRPQVRRDMQYQTEVAYVEAQIHMVLDAIETLGALLHMDSMNAQEFEKNLISEGIDPEDYNIMVKSKIVEHHLHVMPSGELLDILAKSIAQSLKDNLK